MLDQGVWQSFAAVVGATSRDWRAWSKCPLGMWLALAPVVPLLVLSCSWEPTPDPAVRPGTLETWSL